MKAKIFCTINNSIHAFYLKVNGKKYFLFQQAYRRGVNDFFKNGISLNQAFSYSFNRNDTAVIHTIEKIPTHIKYIEKQYSITVLMQTAKRNERRRVA